MVLLRLVQPQHVQMYPVPLGLAVTKMVALVCLPAVAPTSVPRPVPHLPVASATGGWRPTANGRQQVTTNITIARVPERARHLRLRTLPRVGITAELSWVRPLAV